MNSPAQLHQRMSSTLSSIPTLLTPSSSSQVLSPLSLGPWKDEPFPTTSNTGSPIIPAPDAITPLINQPAFPFQFNIQNPEAVGQIPQHIPAAPAYPPVVLSFPRKRKDEFGKLQVPGLKDLLPILQPNFRNTFIRHIMKLVFSGTSPWSNPGISIYQQEFNTIYPDHPFRLHADDAVVLPVCISCFILIIILIFPFYRLIATSVCSGTRWVLKRLPRSSSTSPLNTLSGCFTLRKRGRPT